MTSNVGTTDRVIRIVLGIVLLALGARPCRNGRVGHCCLCCRSRSAGYRRVSLLPGVFSFWNQYVPAEAQPKQVGCAQESARKSEEQELK